MTRLALAVVALLAACARRAPVTSCDDDLHGVWVTDSGARWMMLDNSATLEAYPLFDDSAPEAAPRVIDLRRGEKLQGEVRRRFMAGSALCEATAPIRIAKCKADGLQVVVADPQPPLEMAPCKWPRPAASRLERWHRE
ncbi:MAG: hypothetical protein HOV81_37370 [Kofleriaceae bacterium]|nr:hypothetical protein [Kofleriaceae bacterium]